jgi:O-antigen/teichoic acid export membrane protein
MKTFEPTDPSLGRKAKIGFLWLGTSTILWQGISWAFTLITANLITPDDYGIIALTETFIPYLILLCGLNLQTWIIQKKSFSGEEYKQTAGLSILLSFIVFFIAINFTPSIARFYNKPELTSVLYILSGIFLCKGFSLVPESMLRRELHMKPIAIMNVLVVLLRGIVQVVMAFLGFGYWALVTGILVKELLETIFFIALKKINFSFLFSKNVILEALHFGIPATLGTFFWILYSSSDSMVIGKLLGTHTLSFYAMALYLIDIPLSKLNTLIRPIIFPYLSRIREADGNFEDEFLRIVRLVAGGIIPIMLGIGVTAPTLITVVLSEKWKPTGDLLQMLCFVGIGKTFIDNIHLLFTIIGKPKYVFYNNLLSSLILPLTFYISIKVYAVNGVTLSWCISMSAICLINCATLALTKVISLYRYMLCFREGVLASSIMFGAVYLLQKSTSQWSIVHPILSLIIQCTAGVLIIGPIYIVIFQDEIRKYKVKEKVISFISLKR